RFQGLISIVILIVETTNLTKGRIVPFETCQFLVQFDRVSYRIGSRLVGFLKLFRDARMIEFQPNTVRLKPSIMVRRMLGHIQQLSWHSWENPGNILMCVHIYLDIKRIDQKSHERVVKRRRKTYGVPQKSF